MNMLASEHYLHANVWFKLRTRDTFESIVVTVSFSEGTVRENGAGDCVVQCRGNSVAGAA